MADLDGDGRADIVAANAGYAPSGGTGGSSVTVLRQTSSSPGQFTIAGVYPGTDPGSFIAIGDMNGDGRNDLVLENGPSVLIQSNSAPRTFLPVRTLR
ncbi:FG-GAP repeat domain-containing protein [Rhodoferax sp.]|uniref:FG-GAP repeat domain-containing protein n=1 Tax=Rhodoferax sp. TaxID=50421 RepID=UPI00345C4827